MTKREPNAALSRLLTESRWTYRQFARAVNRLGTETGTPLRYDESAVSHWLAGTMPRGPVRAVIVEAFSRRLGRPVTYSEAGLPAPRQQPADGVDIAQELVDLGRLDMDPSRRGVLAAGLFSAATAIPGWPDVAGRATAVESGRTTRIGMNEVHMVTAMTERISNLNYQFGGRHTRPMAASFLVNTVAPCLRADAPAKIRQAMLTATSNLLYLAAHMAVDDGLHGLAQRYYLKAAELAGAADDRLTYCTVLRGMSVQATGLGHGDKALELANAAAAASPTANPRMRAFFAGQQAHAAARTGDRTGALRHIGEAETAMDRAESHVGVIGSYNPAALNYHVSQVRHELGDTPGAIRAMQLSDRSRVSTDRVIRVVHRCTIAERQLRIGHLDAACATWHQALDDYPLIRSGRADERIRTMLGLIRPHLKNTTTRALDDRARALTQTSV
ncbi:tetratricopeptide repeat protein [Streptomyces chilikensis]|uniref:tetratricopeptide repeat protein n=1 Tax=Streptomyces chilikensis TaxID=1194079 RepID=UPI0019CFAB95|nr:tetratricopeptide repeat protein [Streptomyces chilikensis]